MSNFEMARKVFLEIEIGRPFFLKLSSLVTFVYLYRIEDDFSRNHHFCDFR